MGKQFGTVYKYNNKFEQVKKLLDIHLAIKPPEDNMYDRAKEALAYYIVNGYNKETVLDVETSLSEDVKKGYVRTINSHLRKNGFLIHDANNKHKSHLSPEMQAYRDEFVLKDGKTMMIGFLKNKWNGGN